MAARIVTSAILDDLSRDPPWSSVGTAWRLLTDGVMGGVSTGRMTRETIAGRPALRLRGEVGLANNGGFVQIVLDLSPDGGVVDASRGGESRSISSAMARTIASICARTRSRDHGSLIARL